MNGSGRRFRRLDFAGFALRHTGCGDEVLEVELDEGGVIACWCLRCDELRVFGARRPEFRVDKDHLKQKGLL